MTALRLTVHDEPDAAAARVVDQGLGDSNAAAAPLHEVRPLACFARAADGAVVGGAVGRRWGACAELQQLWVHPDLRRRGLGAQLVRAFEAHAAQHRCTTVYLETFSFQAPRLYASLGYEMRHTIEGFGHGIAKHLMVHRL
ncbi:MAG: GNAT family N-acetyltransferase [Burkholderiaceae bacterium]|nr:GNAT family N-acetyltransferase [Burkholderiaceae bacterium]